MRTNEVISQLFILKNKKVIYDRSVLENQDKNEGLSMKEKLKEDEIKMKKKEMEIKAREKDKRRLDRGFLLFVIQILDA